MLLLRTGLIRIPKAPGATLTAKPMHRTDPHAPSTVHPPSATHPATSLRNTAVVSGSMLGQVVLPILPQLTRTHVHFGLLN